VTGLGLLASALNTFYEDVKYVLTVLLYLLFYLCPIIYFSENVARAEPTHGLTSQQIYTIYHLNPEAMLVTAFRKVLLAPQPVKINQVSYPALPLDLGMLAIATAASFFFLWYGYHVFNKLKWKFVERP
jgi:ABC-type polysaccharide/polyol phosphate export permease